MKTILVADDDKRIRLLLQAELTAEGYQVILANNGLEALKKIEEEPPDLVILDIKMPHMHGLEVLRAIRKKDKELPVIICTAYGKMRNDYTVWASRVTDYLTKPFDSNRLKATIKRSLGERGQVLIFESLPRELFMQ